LNAVITSYRNLKGDKSIWLIVFLLSILSLLAVYSSTGSIAFKDRGGNTEFYLIKQAIFVGLGIFLTWVSYRLHYMKYMKLAPILLAITIPLLLYTLFFGADINQARRWIVIPWIDISFQTSDLAKIALIMFVARSLATKQEFIKDFKQAFLPIILPILLICALIAPMDLSTAALLFVTCLLMMFVGRISLRFVFMLGLAGAAVIALIFALGLVFPDFIRSETWITRITDFFGSSDGEYQVQQAKIAIASGEFFGLGPGNSLQRNYLPYAYADCIYAIICEEYGMIGGIALIGLYLWLLFRSISLVTRSPRAFGAILSLGLALNIVIQAFANIAVSVQLVPATGLTLPMVSMGGTSLIFTCISIGIILSVSRFVEQADIKKNELIEIEKVNAGTN